MDELKNPERQLSSIAHMVSRGAEIHPDRIAIDDLLRSCRLTYLELDRRISQLARALLGLGLKKGDFLGVMLWNEHAVVETIFACARAGIIVAPLNVRLLAEEVVPYVNFHGCKAIVTNADFEEKFEKADATIRISTSGNEGWLEYESLISGESGDPLTVVTSLDDPVRLVSTGGTTGMSKGVLHSHVGVYFTVLGNISEFNVRRGWQTIMIMPTYHAAGMDWGMFPVFWRVGTVVFPEDTSFNGEKYLAEVKAREVEYLQMVPAVINPIHQAWDGTPVTQPKVIVSTSAPTPPALRQRLAEVFPKSEIMAAAGLSESINMATQVPGELLTYPEGVGEPHIDTRLRILDDEDRPVPRNQAGHIALRGFNTALRYNGNEEVSAVTWRPIKGDPEGLCWCFTGDIGVMDDDGKVSIVDRSKDVIITGGETVPSVEVEAAYMEHPRILECAAVGVEDEKWGEAILLVAAVTGLDDGDEALAADLYRYGRQHLAGYKVPKKIAFLDALPRSHFGKILKRDLRDRNFDRIY